MFRFTIRDVLWLMMMVALSCAWLLDHRTQKAQIDFWLGKTRSLILALESREAMLGWGELNTAKYILHSPTHELPIVENGRLKSRTDSY